MAIFLLMSGRKDALFRQAFYTLLISVTFADCVVVCTTWLRYEVGEDGRQFAYYLDDSGVFDVVVLTAHYTAFICRNYQPLCHAALACERFTAFAFPHRQAAMWNPKVLTIVLLIMLAAAIFFTGFPSIFLGISNANLPSRRDPDDNTGWHTSTGSVTDVVRSLNLLGCSVVGTVFVVGTVAMILACRNAADRQEKLQRGQNIRLFVHTLLLLFVQLVVAFLGFVVVAESVFVANRQRNPSFKWLPRWLALDSKKWLYSRARVDNENSPEQWEWYCGVVCSLLTRYDKLPVEELNLHAFADDVFALSGTAVLLAVRIVTEQTTANTSLAFRDLIRAL